MEFERYNPEIHEGLVPEFFSDVAQEPSRFGEFKEATTEAFKDIEDVIGMSADFDVVLAEVDVQQFDESVPEGMYFRGYSLGEKVHDHAEKDMVFLAAPNDYEYWEAGLKNMAVHEEAHQEFFQYITDLDHVVWESMILEGHALLREKTVREKKNYKWRGDPRKYEGSAQQVIDVLDKNREWQGKKYDRDNVCSIFSMDSNWEGIGYVIAQEVYIDIIEQNNIGVDEALTRDNTWLREEVEESIKRLYAEA